MTFDPEEIEATRFTVVRRGFDPAEVTDYLERLADHLRRSDDFRTAGDEVATALRGLHGLLSGMREETEQELAAARAEADEELARLRREAQEHAASVRQEADADAERARREAEEHIAKLRAEADREVRALLAEAEADTTRLLELANGEMKAAERESEAIRQTVRAKREEIDRYVASAGQRAENAAREQVAKVIQDQQAELDRLARSRHEVSLDLERLQSILRSTLDETRRYVDLTGAAADDGDDSGAGGADRTDDELARSIVNEVLNEKPRPPTPF